MYMDQRFIYCAGSTEACRFTRTYLEKMGLPITDQPDSQVGHLLLDVPSFTNEGRLRMGGDIQALLHLLSKDVTIYGGNLNHEALHNYQVVDFLRDESYLAQNAYITAECALDVALPYLSVTLRGCPVLVIGWGRIGKCLAKLLTSIGADVTVAARKDADRAIIRALGYWSVDIISFGENLGTFRLIYNTVPHPVLTRAQSAYCSKSCVMIDLASKSGIDHDDVIIARGLPGIHFPESSGKLIAETFLQYYKKEAGV